MAFVKRTWLARIGTGLNKFIIGEKDANDKQTLVNSPDSVSQQGDVISADNLNDLEQRIYDEFTVKADKTYVDTQLATKQNTLTFDDAPTNGSNNPVKSGGVYTALAGKVSPSDFVIETVRWYGEWFNPYADRSRMSFNFSVGKSGYTPIGIVGHNIELYDTNNDYIKFSVTFVALDTAHNFANVFITFLEGATVKTTYSGASINVLYVKNS